MREQNRNRANINFYKFKMSNYPFSRNNLTSRHNLHLNHGQRYPNHSVPKLPCLIAVSVNPNPVSLNGSNEEPWPMAEMPVSMTNCNCIDNSKCKGSCTDNIPIDMVANTPVTKVLLSEDVINKNGLHYIRFGLSRQTSDRAKTNLCHFSAFYGNEPCKL